jgi:photosystem II stability/assembly factor-like uncharacterized protein
MAFLATRICLSRAILGTRTKAPRWQRLVAAPLGILSLGISPGFARDRTVFAGGATGVSVSTDAGETWRATGLPIADATVTALSFAPTFPDGGPLLVGTAEDGVWLTRDRGRTWQAANFGLLDALVFSLACSPAFADDETIFAGTDTAIYHSYNGARAWKQLPFPEAAGSVLSLLVSKAFSTDHTVFAGTSEDGLYRSGDRGEHWERLDLPAQSVNGLAPAASGRGMFAATDAGLFFSPDAGTTWQTILDSRDMFSLAVDGEVGLAGSADQGAWLMTDRARWRSFPIPPSRSITGMALSPRFEADGVAFMFGPQEGIWRTADGGASWASLGQLLPNSDYRALAVSPAFAGDRAMAVATPAGVLVSTDGGDSWLLVKEGSSDMVCFAQDVRTQVGRLGAAFRNGALWFSSDLGRSWVKAPGPWEADAARVVALAIDGDARVRVAVHDAVRGAVRVWQGTPDHYEPVLSQPCVRVPVVCFHSPRAWSGRDSWFVSIGDRVWRIDPGGRSMATECGAVGKRAPGSEIIGLASGETSRGAGGAGGRVLFACTGSRLYSSTDANTWKPSHDFGNDVAIAFALSPTFDADGAAFILLLGGAFCRCALRP